MLRIPSLKSPRRKLLLGLLIVTTILVGYETISGPRLRYWLARSRDPVATNVQQRPEGTLRVLFIGNSFTWYFGGQARLGMQLANSAFETQLNDAEQKQFKPAVFDQITGDGWELDYHIENGRTVNRIAEKHWDYVVLQDHSQETLLYPERFRAAVIALDREVKKNGAKTVLFMTWARSFEPQNQAQITRAYQNVGKEIGAPVVPVGLAFEKVQRTTLIRVIDQTDGRHATAAGSYLIACCFYSFFYHRSAEGLSASLVADGNKLITLDEATAHTLAKIAWETTKEILEP